MLERQQKLTPQQQASAWASQKRNASFSPPQPRRDNTNLFSAPRPLGELLADAKNFERQGDYKRAFEIYEEAIKRRKSPELLNRAAECLIRLKTHLKHAEKRARQAVAASPETAAPTRAPSSPARPSRSTASRCRSSSEA